MNLKDAVAKAYEAALAHEATTRKLHESAIEILRQAREMYESEIGPVPSDRP